MINRVVKVNVPKIKQLANKKGLSLTKLEDKLGFSNGTIGKWNKTGASLNSFCILADYLEVDMRDLYEKI